MAETHRSGSCTSNPRSGAVLLGPVPPNSLLVSTSPGMLLLSLALPSNGLPQRNRRGKRMTSFSTLLGALQYHTHVDSILFSFFLSRLSRLSPLLVNLVMM
jgi:hypothetical protein